MAIDSKKGNTLESLQAENLRLRQQLEELLREARRNQDTLGRFDELERKVIAAPSLAALVQVLLVEFKSLFELDAITLAFVDPHHEVARILGDDADALPAGLLLPPERAAAAAALCRRRPRAAGRPAAANDFLFAASDLAGQRRPAAAGVARQRHRQSEPGQPGRDPVRRRQPAPISLSGWPRWWRCASTARWPPSASSAPVWSTA